MIDGRTGVTSVRTNTKAETCTVGGRAGARQRGRVSHARARVLRCFAQQQAYKHIFIIIFIKISSHHVVLTWAYLLMYLDGWMCGVVGVSTEGTPVSGEGHHSITRVRVHVYHQQGEILKTFPLYMDCYIYLYIFIYSYHGPKLRIILTSYFNIAIVLYHHGPRVLLGIMGVHLLPGKCDRARKRVAALRSLPLNLSGGAMRSIPSAHTRTKMLYLCRDNIIAHFFERCYCNTRSGTGPSARSCGGSGGRRHCVS